MMGGHLNNVLHSRAFNSHHFSNDAGTNPSLDSWRIRSQQRSDPRLPAFTTGTPTG